MYSPGRSKLSLRVPEALRTELRETARTHDLKESQILRRGLRKALNEVALQEVEIRP
jgi:hypothetical protein